MKTKRYVVEPFNGYLEANVLKECLVRPWGLVKKTAMVKVGLVSYDAEATLSLIVGAENFKTVGKYWA